MEKPKTKIEMEPVKDFKGLVEKFRNLPQRKTVVVVCPYDTSTIAAVDRLLTEDLADVILVNDARRIEQVDNWKAAYPDKVTVIDTESIDDAAAAAVKEVREGRGDVLAKGLINTDNLLRAILNKEHGLLPAGTVLSQFGVAEIPGYDKLLILSDAAIIPYPTLEQFDSMIECDTRLARKLGHERPNVALVHFTEKVNKKFPVTLDYDTLKGRAAEGKYGNCAVEGPMDIKTALDAHSSEMKGIAGEVPGHADIVVMPDLEAANAFYKTLVRFGNAVIASLVNGTTAPVTLPSRADSPESKFYAIALACISAQD